jgi:hypothetical protein
MLYLARRVFDALTGLVPLRVQKLVGGILAGAYIILGLCDLFDRTIFGIDPQRPYAIVIITGLVFLLVFGRGLAKDATARNAERKRREAEYEKSYVRDPEVEEQMRRDMGMQPNDSSERSHDL